jgi:hypothetical protein
MTGLWWRLYISGLDGYEKADTGSVKKRGITQKRVHNASEYFLWDTSIKIEKLLCACG